MAAASLLLHIVLLTSLLELSGGPSNPFTVIYVAQIALAAVTLGRGWAYVCAGTAVGCYGLLISWHMEETVPAHHRFVDFPTHLFAMFIATTTLTELALHFAGAASSAIARRQALLDDARAQTARAERVVSITTLAAGAAHELSTPLATIAITARELQRSLEARAAADQWTDDARLIRSEVDRCRAILDQMSGRAGGSSADEAETVDLRLLVEEVRARLADDRMTRLMVDLPVQMPNVLVPRAGLRQTVLALVVNAFDASVQPDAPVALRVTATDRTVCISVRDDGPGLEPDAMRRAGEPFFTTKEAGKGLGLGLFLARIFAERLGGSLRLESDGGTNAVLELPLGAAAAELS